MEAYDTFSPVRWIPNGIIMDSVKEHRTALGEVPRFRLLRQIVKAKIKSKYPQGWRYK